MSLKSDWKKLLGSVAPALGAAIGGPFAPIAGAVVGKVLTGKENASEEEIEKALVTASPDKLLELKQADMQFKKDMKALDVDIERLHQKDRESARAREAQVGGVATPVLATVIIVTFLATVAGVLFGNTAVDSALAGTLIGYVSAKAEQVVSYYFGSSAGSKQKTLLMKKEEGPN